MKAHEVLQRAQSHLSERGETYDSEGGERSMQSAVEAFNAITGQELSASDGWLLMALVKLVRAESATGAHTDSLDDGCAYLSLYAEAQHDQSAHIEACRERYLREVTDCEHCDGSGYREAE